MYCVLLWIVLCRVLLCNVYCLPLCIMYWVPLVYYCVLLCIVYCVPLHIELSVLCSMCQVPFLSLLFTTLYCVLCTVDSSVFDCVLLCIWLCSPLYSPLYCTVYSSVFDCALLYIVLCIVCSAKFLHQITVEDNGADLQLLPWIFWIHIWSLASAISSILQSGGAPQDHRFRIRKEGVWPDLDPVRYSGVPRTRNHTVQGTVQYSTVCTVHAYARSVQCVVLCSQTVN